MKFKIIFIIFNIIIIVSFIFFFSLPLFILGVTQFATFISKYWFLLSLFILTLFVFNLYFITNWKFFYILEKEDWYSLVTYLETKIYKQKKISMFHIKILLNSYLCTLNYENIKRLENYLKNRKPKVINKFPIQFGMPYLLTDNYQDAEEFFSNLISQNKIEHSDWIHWNYGISLMKQQKFEEAKKIFLSILTPENDIIVYLLALYMLSKIPNTDPSIIEEMKNDFSKKYSNDKIIERVEKQQNNIQIASMQDIIEKASNWLYL